MQACEVLGVSDAKHAIQPAYHPLRVSLVVIVTVVLPED